jgi:hypothetical protein
MNVAVELNTITTSNPALRTRIGELRRMSLEQAIAVSMELKDHAEVEAVIVVEGDAAPSGWARAAQRLNTAVTCWLWNLRQPRAQAGAQPPHGGELVHAA